MELVLITAMIFIAEGVGTLTGFGTSTILFPVLLFFYPFPEALLLVGLIHWFGNLWKVLLFKEGVRWRLILLFGATGAIFSFIGAKLVFVLPEELLLRFLGSFFIAYVIFLVLKPDFKINKTDLSALVGGGLSGFSSGIFGIGGAVRGAFLSIYNLPKGVYIATAGAIGFAIDSVRLVTYKLSGIALPAEIYWGFLVFIPVSFFGARTAKKLVDKIPQNKFRYVVSFFIFLVGLRYLFFP